MTALKQLPREIIDLRIVAAYDAAQCAGGGLWTVVLPLLPAVTPKRRKRSRACEASMERG